MLCGQCGDIALCSIRIKLSCIKLCIFGRSDTSHVASVSRILPNVTLSFNPLARNNCEKIIYVKYGSLKCCKFLVISYSKYCSFLLLNFSLFEWNSESALQHPGDPGSISFAHSPFGCSTGSLKLFHLKYLVQIAFEIFVFTSAFLSCPIKTEVLSSLIVDEEIVGTY